MRTPALYQHCLVKSFYYWTKAQSYACEHNDKKKMFDFTDTYTFQGNVRVHSIKIYTREKKTNDNVKTMYLNTYTGIRTWRLFSVLFCLFFSVGNVAVNIIFRVQIIMQFYNVGNIVRYAKRIIMMLLCTCPVHCARAEPNETIVCNTYVGNEK